MPKRPLCKEDSRLESELIFTLQAGLKSWRSDLIGPESYSDWEACVRPLLQKYEVKLRAAPVPLRFRCDYCDGEKKFRTPPNKEKDCWTEINCKECKGSGYYEGY